MAEPSSLAVLRAALPRLLDDLPAGAPVRILRAVPGVAAGARPDLSWSVEQGFKPLHEALQAEGFAVTDGLSAPVGPAPARVLVLMPRSREEGRALLARGLLELGEGGVLAGAALNDEGARSFEKDLAALSPLGGQLNKAHGRVFWSVPRPAVLPPEARALAERWIAADEPRCEAGSGLWQRPGVFNEGRLDAGSAMLIEHLPRDLRGAVADLGAGTGLLAKAVLERCPAVSAIDLFEAEARSLALARRNLEGARVLPGFHWIDVAAGVPGRFDAVVCNPPFHVGSRGVPALGRAFIAAAARLLAGGGPLLLVANRHLPYEDALREVFGRGELLAEQAGFKVYRAWDARD